MFAELEALSYELSKLETEYRENHPKIYAIPLLSATTGAAIGSLLPNLLKKITPFNKSPKITNNLFGIKIITAATLGYISYWTGKNIRKKIMYNPRIVNEITKK